MSIWVYVYVGRSRPTGTWARQELQICRNLHKDSELHACRHACIHTNTHTHIHTNDRIHTQKRSFFLNWRDYTVIMTLCPKGTSIIKSKLLFNNNFIIWFIWKVENIPSKLSVQTDYSAVEYVPITNLSTVDCQVLKGIAWHFGKYSLFLVLLSYKQSHQIVSLV